MKLGSKAMVAREPQATRSKMTERTFDLMASLRVSKRLQLWGTSRRACDKEAVKVFVEGKCGAWNRVEKAGQRRM